MDAGWSKFLKMLEYKAGRAGVQIEKVNPNGTTQICSNCGKKIQKSSKDRKHICECGLKIDRDYNSAINPVEIPVGESRKQDAR